MITWLFSIFILKRGIRLVILMLFAAAGLYRILLLIFAETASIVITFAAIISSGVFEEPA